MRGEFGVALEGVFLLPAEAVVCWLNRIRSSSECLFSCTCGDLGDVLSLWLVVMNFLGFVKSSGLEMASSMVCCVVATDGSCGAVSRLICDGDDVEVSRDNVERLSSMSLTAWILLTRFAFQITYYLYVSIYQGNKSIKKCFVLILRLVIKLTVWLENLIAINLNQPKKWRNKVFFNNQ